MLQTILSVSGKPGLYRLLSQGKNTLIVESLQTKQRMPILPKDRVVSLGDISMFTVEEDVPLAEVLTRVHAHQQGAPFADDLLKVAEALRDTFGLILTNYDRERVYTSDIKKLFVWYNILIGAGITSYVDEETPAAE